MNSLEASRVLGVLDEALESLRLLSFVTNEVLDTSHQLTDLLGEDAVALLGHHRSLLPSSSKANIGGNDAVVTSTWELARMLKKSAACQRLQGLHTERSPAVLQAVSFMERLRAQVAKCLSTTVEEDVSNREYYEEVAAREEKAVSEKVALEQKLKLQRVELARRNNAVQTAEDKARAELHAVHTSASTAAGGIQTDAASTRKNDIASYAGEAGNLEKELQAARDQLAALRAANKEAEAAARKAKRRAAQDVEAVVAEYDNDVGAKEAEYQAALAEYRRVLAQFEEASREAATMQAERLAAEAEDKRREDERLQAALRIVRLNRAARAIQASWKAYKAKKAAEAKKKKKLEAAKNKKK